MLGTRTPFQWVMLALAMLLGLALVVVFGFRTLTEASGTNSYALIAESFLTGTPWASACFDIDCAQFDGRKYFFFPPFRGVVAMRLVALTGI
jgi:hypothetical protein